VSWSKPNLIVMTCDLDTPLCSSTDSHVHMIKHELSEDHEHLKTTSTIYAGGKSEKDTVYHFDRKQ